MKYREADRNAATICGLVVAALLVGCAVNPGTLQKTPVLGYLNNQNDRVDRLEAFTKGLAELGYVEGKNIRIEFRRAKLDSEYAALAADLIDRKVDLILVGNAPAAVAAHKATKTVPIVMGAVNDPVRLGLVNSLEHPGTNVTGTTMFAPQLIAERVRLLKATVPGLSRVAMIANGSNANNAAQFQLLKSGAEEVGIAAYLLDARTPPDIAPAFEKATALHVGGLFNGVDNFINSQRFALAKLAAQYKLPFFYTDEEYVLAGGLMALGPGHLEGFHGAASYVDKILRGASPSDLAVAGPTHFTLSVSRSALRNMDLRLPVEVEARVTDWQP